ncbi:hypothetical protein [Paracoccus ravus]|uniref:hypothetical protein n=1 Tax=Paracoccus ravus TaxID=2447760 RepID=UPI00106E553D|nr:hypothetical protein [Paracoccus ravus]
MQPDLVARFGLSDGSGNVGDVLASIRRLIAQDQIEAPPGPTDPAEHAAQAALLLAPGDLVPAQSAPLSFAEAVFDEPALSPDEEAEFAEAEAALARMLAPQRAADPVSEPEFDDMPLVSPGFEAVNLFAPPVSNAPPLRDLLRDILREELRGDLGMQASAQIRGMIRGEIESVIRDMCRSG